MTSATATPAGEVDEQFDEGLRRLTRDLYESAEMMGRPQASFLVDFYYQQQEARIAFNHQLRMAFEGSEPSRLFSWLADQQTAFEENIKRALGRYARAQPVGRWLQDIPGIGPVMSAGILALFDIEHAPTPGHFWRYAGLDPTSKWLGADGAKQVMQEVAPAGPLTAQAVIAAAGLAGRKVENLARLAQPLNKKTHEPEGEITRASLQKALARRPWNADAKRLMFLAGESFVKVQGSPRDVYGQLYLLRKVYEQEHNEAGAYSDQARAAITDKKYGEQTDALAWYTGCFTPEAAREIRTAEPDKRPALVQRLKGAPGSGIPMLPPARIQMRSTRYARKLFLRDVHRVMFWERYHKTPPRDYQIEHLGHAHTYAPPFLAEHFPDLLEAMKKDGPISDHQRAS